MTDEEIKMYINEAAKKAADQTLDKLKDKGRVTYINSNSFKKTEELLMLYPKLPEGHPEKLRIDKALEKIQDDDYCDIIASRYFDGLSITKIAEIYNCNYQQISKKRAKLMKILASELFPEDVLKELLEK